MPRSKYDWDNIRTEYITSDLSLKDISDKYGVSQRLVNTKSAEQGWVDQRKKYNAKVVEKAVNKVAAKRANQLAKELTIADNISNVLKKALDDAEQFNRYIIDTTTRVDGTEIRTSEEKTFEKVDMRALKDAAAALRLVEEMKRSMAGILRVEEINRNRREEKRLKLEEEKLQLQKEQTEARKPDTDIKVVITGYEQGWDE